ncbi:MAG: HAD family hydrolase [Candidatus Omnitrophota bacterium]|jgi:phosphoglycolate phosphatase-like HAD superfamily hydrolase|nr:MAG: HAD family hydrolase [Candidatus Omnitrophota bacterium]
MVDLPIQFREIELIVLDMDGVITSEEAYWDSAGLVVREILESPAYLGLSPPHYTPISEVFYHRLAGADRSRMRKYLPSDLIRHCKARGINSNWDLAYLTVGLYLAPLFSSTMEMLVDKIGEKAGEPDPFRMIGHAAHKKEVDAEIDERMAPNLDLLKEELSPVWDRLQEQVKSREWSSLLRTSDLHLWGSYFRKLNRTVAPIKNIALRIIDDFHPDMKGLRLLDELNALLSGHPFRRWTLFGRNTALWEDCRDLFQRWYLGEELYEKTYGRSLLYKPKSGMVHHEEPLHGREKTHRCLTRLKQAGFRLGIATGRPRMEIMTPLAEWGMTHYFEPERIVTHDEVEEAENELKQQNCRQNVGKPHPYVFLQAIHPDQSAAELIQWSGPAPGAEKVLVIGDAQADLWAGQKAGCRCAAVLSGAVGHQGRRLLEEAKPDVICQDILELTEALIAVKQGA